MTWSAAERSAWKSPELLSPSQWAAKFRRLEVGKGERYGPWENEYTPYLVGVMDIGTDAEQSRWPAARAVHELVLVKPAQAGGSEAVRNRLLCKAERDPAPVLYVMPDEVSLRRIFSEEIGPAFRATRALDCYRSGDVSDDTKEYIQLTNGFSLLGAWSGSPARLASKPCQESYLDEVDKFPPFSGRESDPVALSKQRLKTWSRPLLALLSTPTTDQGLITQHADRCAVQLHWLVPCPHCAKYQILTFDTLKFAKPADVESYTDWLSVTPGAAWMQCKFCGARIEESEKAGMALRGVWALESKQGATRGELHVSPGTICYDDWPPGVGVAMYMDPFSCPFPATSWNNIAAGFIAAKDDIGKLMDFFNGTLGRVFRHRVSNSTNELLRERQKDAPPAGTVPTWARKLIATVDQQHDRFYYVVRAWGHAYRSQRVDHGLLTNEADIERVLIQGTWPSVDPGRPRMRCEMVGGDAADKPYFMYSMTLRYPYIFKALKGEYNERSATVRPSRISYSPPNAPRNATLEVWLHLFHADRYRDILAARMNQMHEAADGTPEQVWMLNNRDDAEYRQQMQSEHKVLMRKNRRMVEGWCKVTAGAENHYFDCEVMQMVMADIARVELLPPTPERVAGKEPRPRTRTTRSPVRRDYGLA